MRRVPGPRHHLLAAVAIVAVVLAACSGGADDEPGPTADVGEPRGATGRPQLVRATVFEEDQDGADTYRIPSVGVTEAGTIVAVAEQRIVSARDDDPRALVARTSADGGATWSDLVELAAADDQSGCYPADPVTLAPTTGAAAGDVLVVFRPCRGVDDGIAIVRSSDEGVTWSAPEPIELDRAGRLTPAQADALRPGPGHGIELGDAAPGRLVVVADSNLASVSPKVLTLLLSDDGGVTWRAGATYEVPEGGPAPDESAVAVAADGSLVISSRGGAPGRRQLAASADGEELLELNDGEQLAATTGVASTPVQGSLLTLPDGRVVLSTLNDLDVRRGLRFHVHDGGADWTLGTIIHPDAAAYSDLALYDERTVLVLAETGDRHPYERIEVIPVPVDDVGPSTEPLPPANPPASYANGRLLVDDERFRITSFCIGAPVMELDGGRIEIDLSRGLDAVAVEARIDDTASGEPIEFTGTIPVAIDDGGRLYRGPITDDTGRQRQIDLVLGYGVPC